MTIGDLMDAVDALRSEDRKVDAITREPVNVDAVAVAYSRMHKAEREVIRLAALLAGGRRVGW